MNFNEYVTQYLSKQKDIDCVSILSDISKQMEIPVGILTYIDSKQIMNTYPITRTTFNILRKEYRNLIIDEVIK